MANVNTDSLRSVSASITDIIGRLKAAASYTESACDSLANYANNLKGYNGQKVAEDQRQDSIVNPNDQNVVDMHYYYNTWVTDDGGIAESANQLQKYTTEMLTIVDGLSSKAGVIDSIARTIDSYINSVEATIGNGTTSSPFSPDDTLCSLAGLSFGRKGVEKSNLYFNGERLDYESFLKTGLQNTQLTFKLQDDGTYKVYSNGKETEYSTDALTAAFYQKTLMDQTKAKFGNGTDSPAGDNKSTTGDHHAKSGLRTKDKKGTSTYTTSEGISTVTTVNGITTVTTKLKNGNTKVNIHYNNNSGRETVNGTTKIYDKDGNLLESSSAYKNNPHGLMSVTKNETTGETTVKFNPSKNEEGMTSKITTKDSTKTTTYDSSKSDNGRTKQVHNTDGSYTITYDSSKNDQGKTNEVHNTDSSYTITYDSSIQPRGRTSLKSKNGIDEITYDTNSKNNPAHRTTALIKDGVSTLTYENGDTYTYTDYSGDGTYTAADGHIVYNDIDE